MFSSIVRGQVTFGQSITLASSTANLPLNDSLIGSTFLATMGTIYRLYRFKEVHVRLLPGANSTIVSCTYLPTSSAGTNDPTTLAANESTWFCATLQFGQTVGNVSQMRLSQKAMKGLTDWYVTKADSDDSNIDNQGTLYFASGDATAQFFVILTVSYEFKAPADSAVLDLLALRERSLKTLSETHVLNAHAGLFWSSQDVEKPKKKRTKKKKATSTLSSATLSQFPKSSGMPITSQGRTMAS